MRTEKEKMLAEDLYIANDEELGQDVKKSRRLTRLFNGTTEEQSDYRKVLLKELLGEVGEKYHIEPPFHCYYGQHISIGDHFYANFDCVILDVAKVSIGNNVMFGPKVALFTASHPIDPIVRISGLELGKQIKIGDNVWIGGNSTVNPGVTIGDNVVIGSGSVVTKDIPKNVVAAGNPCRVIRAIDENDKVYWENLQEEYWLESKKAKKELL